MATLSNTNQVSLPERIAFIKNFPCFSMLNESQAAELATLLKEVNVVAQERITTEKTWIDSIYLIVKGIAEVSHPADDHSDSTQIPIAVLERGEAIGLNDGGFYSTTGLRSATVTALTEMLLLRLNVGDLSVFLAKHALQSNGLMASKQMLRMQLIKQSLPFAKISPERLQWLAGCVEEVQVSAGQYLFKQGEVGHACFLILSGEIEIVVEEPDHTLRTLAILKSSMLFGEATLITRSVRNATARARVDCELLSIDESYLTELLETEDNVATMFMTLMVDRSRPLRHPQITLHQRISTGAETVTILKNAVNHRYFKLSPEGAFIWEQLNGKQTIQDITLSLAKKFNVFAPDVVVGLISRLAKAGFLTNVNNWDTSKTQPHSTLDHLIARVNPWVVKRFTFGDVNPFLTRIYQRYIRYLFTKPAQIILALITCMGLAAFVINTPNVLLFFSFKHASLWLLLTLIPFSLFEVVLHELGHAFAVKAFKRDVHYMGVGWEWLVPLAFTDTSDIWLSPRKERILVNLAGIYVDFLSAGCAALASLWIANPYIQGTFWLFAFYTYIHGIRMLSPLQELDGYYVLMDWLEKNHLRYRAVVWLLKYFPKSLHDGSLFRVYKAEAIYWVACIIYLLLISAITLVVQEFVFSIFEVQVNVYIRLIIPFLVIIFSSFQIFLDIKKQRDDD